MLVHRVALHRRAMRYARCVWHLRTAAVAAEAPSVERTDDSVAIDLAAVAEVRA